MRTFCIETLGCKVNQYESEQIATLLRCRGLVQVDRPEEADLRVVNTCSVTIQAASKSRQSVRQAARAPLKDGLKPALRTETGCTPSIQRVVVAGCWATSDASAASSIPGVCAVLGHQDNIADQLQQLISRWQFEDALPPAEPHQPHDTDSQPSPEPLRDDGWMKQAGTPAARSSATHNKPLSLPQVKKNSERIYKHFPDAQTPSAQGTPHSLPLLSGRQSSHQRAFLKIQDGCDAHCTYCIIPKLRSRLWSKPVEEAVAEARNLVAAGHVELVLTGIFLGAYGQPTALRRRQPYGTGKPLAELVDALCTGVPGLRRLRLSSLEPGDLTDDLLGALRSHRRVVPHFHLPLQSGADAVLRKMNRQYGREDYLRMVDRIRAAFDRPAITTDIIVGFPGESDELFGQTLEVVDRVGFIHIHAFSFSPRPGTAAARWEREFVRGQVVNERIHALRERAGQFSLAFRRQFVEEVVELMVEREERVQGSGLRVQEDAPSCIRHGRCERYFPVFFESPTAGPGDCVRVRIDRVTAHRTVGTLVDQDFL